MIANIIYGNNQISDTLRRESKSSNPGDTVVRLSHYIAGTIHDKNIILYPSGVSANMANFA